MKGEVVLTALVLFALMGLSSIAISEEIEIESPVSTNSTNETINASTNGTSQPILAAGNETGNVSAVSTSGLPDFSLIELSQTAPAGLKIPINISCNSTKEVWNSPNDIPTFVFAAITNKGNNNMSVYTRSLDHIFKTRSEPEFAGVATSGENGLIVLGRFVAIEVACDCPQLSNASPQERCFGSIETINAFPK